MQAQTQPQQGQPNLPGNGVVLSNGQHLTYEQLQQTYPLLYSQYVKNLAQPAAGLQQTQASTGEIGAQTTNIKAATPKIQRESTVATAPELLAQDLQKKMTLPTAMSIYKAKGMSADDILNQYISESPWGFPNQTPTELHNMGVSDKIIGQPGQANTYADRFNTRNALNEINTMQQVWNNTGLPERVMGQAGLSKNVRLYNQAQTAVGEHLSSLIPGGSNAQGSVDQLTKMLPSITDPRIDNDTANALFNQAKKLLMQQKGYTSKDLGVNQNFLQQLANQPQKTQSPVKGSTLLNGLLQTALPVAGAVGGGIGGGFLGALVPGANLTGIPEAAGAVGGASVGGAGGQALADLLTGKKPGADVAVTGATSALGEGSGVVLGKALGLAGKGLANYGSNLISKNLNLTPTMSATVAKDMGVKSVSNFLSKEGLEGADYDKISSAVTPIQQQFDNIANNPNIKIKTSDIVDAFHNQIQDLQSSILPAAKAKAKVLSDIASNFIDKYGNQSELTAPEVNLVRQGVDKTVKDFGSDPLTASTGNLTRKILSKSVENADPTNSLDALGNRLNQYYTLLEKAEPRQYVSQPGSGGLKSLFGIKDASAAFIGNMFGGPTGAVAGIGLEKILGSKVATKLASKGSLGLGKLLQSQAINQTSRIGGASTGAGIGAIFGQ